MRRRLGFLRVGMALVMLGGLVAGRLSIEPATPAAVADEILNCEDFPYTGNEDFPVHTSYDPETGLITAFRGPDTFIIDPTSPTCLSDPDIEIIIADTEEVWAEDLIMMCNSVKAALGAGGPVRDHIEGVDLDAGREFLEQWCKGMLF